MSECLVGNVVVLNSGGPKMTVSSEVNALGYFECYWFSDNQKLEKEFFHASALKLIDSCENSTETTADVSTFNSHTPISNDYEDANPFSGECYAKQQSIPIVPPPPAKIPNPFTQSSEVLDEMLDEMPGF